MQMSIMTTDDESGAQNGAPQTGAHPALRRRRMGRPAERAQLPRDREPGTIVALDDPWVEQAFMPAVKAKTISSCDACRPHLSS
jgi:hypothetical protein